MRTAIEDCHKTLRPLMMHHDPILIWLQKVLKFRRFETKQLRFEDFSPHCDLDLEDRNPNFSHDTPGHDDTYNVPSFIKKG